LGGVIHSGKNFCLGQKALQKYFRNKGPLIRERGSKKMVFPPGNGVKKGSIKDGGGEKIGDLEGRRKGES